MITNVAAALLISVAGALCLAAWLRSAKAEDAPPFRMLGKSALLFILPMVAFIAVTEYPQPLAVSVIVLVAFEEGLKLIASRTEKQGRAAFRLVMLFAIWELMFAKPYQALGYDLAEWARHHLYGLVLVTIVPLLMHTVTALIYAFYARRWRWLQFGVCFLIHLGYNAGLAFFDMLGVAWVFLIGSAVGLAVLSIVLWPDEGSPRFGGRSPQRVE